MRWWIILFLLVCLAGACCRKHLRSADSTANALMSAPDTVTIDGIAVILETYLWRDFMPVSPPDGQPLRAVITVLPVNSEYLPAGIDADKIWIITGSENWVGLLEKTGEYTAGRPLTRLEKTSGGGPKWGPGINVEVVVQLRDKKGNTYLLGAGKQLIHRTD